MSNHTQQSFKNLAALALALPGISQAATPVENVQIELGFSQYSEDDINADDVIFGSLERYDIDVSDFSLVAPLGANNQIELAYSIDEMSGASPWFVMDMGGEYVQAMSGATITDERKDWLIGWSHYTNDTTYSLQTGRSIENDYQATNLGVSVEHELNNANTVLGFAFSRSVDQISASGRDIFATRPVDENKQTNTVAFSLSQVINPTLIMRGGVSYETQSGYLSDPYKLANVGGMLIQENRPDSRHATVVSLGARQYLTDLDAAIKADYRYYGDSWGVGSNTLELAWHQTILEGFSLEPNVRWYKQSRADFYANAFDEGATAYSSDPRLSSFTGNAYGLIINKAILSAVVSLSAEKYRSSADSNKPLYHPLALTDYSLFTLSVRFEFN